MHLYNPTKQHPLAEGFATYCRVWAQKFNAPEPSIHAISKVAKQLIIAEKNGHVCLLSDDWTPLCSREALLASGIVGQPETLKEKHYPMTLDQDNRVYLARHFIQESRLAQAISQRIAQPALCTQNNALQQLQKTFPDLHENNIEDPENLQKLALLKALQQCLLIISGGPGTGKTSAVSLILNCLLSSQPTLRIALAAPTGKAAAHLSRSLGTLSKIQTDNDLLRNWPHSAVTLHNLLGIWPNRSVSRYNKNNLLPLDLLIVDEASMLDLDMAVKLFEAMPQKSRLILLGDKDQLAAVESGAVFSELSNPVETNNHASLSKASVHLTQSYRFAPSSAQGLLAQAVLTGKAHSALDVISNANPDQIRLHKDGGAALSKHTMNVLQTGYQKYIEALQHYSASTPKNTDDQIAALFNAFDSFRVLCANQKGLRGARLLNEKLDSQFYALSNTLFGTVSSSPNWYIGKPIVILQNNHKAQLFNGDIGICMARNNNASSDQKHFVVYFPDRTTDSTSHAFRYIPALSLPPHSPAWAFTIHKAQGSEFDAAAIILPIHDSPLLTRELLYTAITRVRQRLDIFSTDSILSTAITQATHRRNGLLARIKQFSRAQ